MLKQLMAFTLALLLPALAFASSPEGLWRTIDDATGDPSSIVKIWQQGDELLGEIQELIDSDSTLCTACTGERKDQPLVGMVFLWGMQPKGEHWGGGRILDPGNGKEYKSKMMLLDDGDKLEVRGYIGFSLLGRSQIWERIN